MKLLEDLMNKKTEMQITPLIDVVFLLLIYFMVTASLIKKEADLSFMLPAKVDTPDPITLPPSESDLVNISVGTSYSVTLKDDGKVLYPVADGIPVLLESESINMEQLG